MPTARARTFLVAAAVLYLFANQTQVGWLYVMSALLAGSVLTGAWMSRGALRRIGGERRIGDSSDTELFENDSVSIALTLRQQAPTGASQLRVIEHCPLAAPDSPMRQIVMFIPSLPAHEAVQFEYQVSIYRRGLRRFPPVQLESRAPFGFFQQHRDLDVPGAVLVYPEVRSLHHLDLLDRQLAPQITRPRAGHGSEILGVRPFRSGDSPRQIHWRSVARTGQLISKEYADEAQPGLTLALDLYRHPYSPTESKHTPFEWAVKCAASIGDYALHKGYPLHLLADAAALPTPPGPISRYGLLQYLARVEPTGQNSLASLLAQPVQNFLAVILSWSDRQVLATLLDLHQRRVAILAIVIDPQTFPDGGLSAAPLADELRAAGIETRYVTFADDWTQQLMEHPVLAGQNHHAG